MLKSFLRASCSMLFFLGASSAVAKDAGQKNAVGNRGLLATSQDQSKSFALQFADDAMAFVGYLSSGHLEANAETRHLNKKD